MLWHPKTLQNLAMYNVFFHFWPFFHCRKATKMTQNSISIPSCAQTPKNPRKMSKTPPYSGLGAKPFLAPPAKADIATAILTNVIEHLVLLFCPPISTPSPPKRCGRILLFLVLEGIRNSNSGFAWPCLLSWLPAVRTCLTREGQQAVRRTSIVASLLALLLGATICATSLTVL